MPVEHVAADQHNLYNDEDKDQEPKSGRRSFRDYRKTLASLIEFRLQDDILFVNCSGKLAERELCVSLSAFWRFMKF